MPVIERDGEYKINVELSGGSGRANVKTPAALYVRDGKMTAEIEWSSPDYDYMEINGKEYYPVNESGNSRFIIDVPELGADIEARAETVAMSEPHIIEYTLRFDSAPVKHSAPLLIIPVIFAAAAAVFIKRRKAHAEK